MRAADDAPDGFVYTPLDQLRHDLKSPLTTIYAHAQLLGRVIRHTPAAEGERATMFAGITAIETAVRTMCAVIDAIGDEDPGS